MIVKLVTVKTRFGTKQLWHATDTPRRRSGKGRSIKAALRDVKDDAERMTA